MPREYFFVSDLHVGEDEQLKILDFERIQKAPPRELSLLQRLVARSPKRDALQDIPERTVI